MGGVYQKKERRNSLKLDIMFFRKYWDYIILALIILLAAYVRLYHFSDWLFFAMDQARDAFLSADAFEKGASQLPLLGPRAAGTFLRLGPVFYYFQYVSARIFNSIESEVFAYPDLFFSILSIPLFYFFLRLYFKKGVSLLSTSVYAGSFLAVQYSRFAWNPNSIPFWILVCFYSLIKISRAESHCETHTTSLLIQKTSFTEIIKRIWRFAVRGEKYLWIGASAVGFSVVTQLHFLAFLAVPIIILAYIIWNKTYRSLGWRGILLFIAIVLVFYAPMIASEIKTSGDNVGQFMWALGSKPAENSMLSNVKNNILAHGRFYFLFLTSYQSRTVTPSQAAGLIFVAGGLAMAFLKLLGEKDPEEKSFLRLFFVWFTVMFLILIPFAPQLKPRFFFVAFFLPFILYAFWMEWFLDTWRTKYFSRIAVMATTLLIIALNTDATLAWYKGIATNTEPKAWRGRVLDLKQTDKLAFTNKQIKDISDYLYSRSLESGKKIYVSANMAYRVPIQYIFEEEKNPPANYGIPSRKTVDRDALYFSVRMQKYSGQPIQEMEKRLRGKFDVIGKKNFGLLTVYELKLRDIQPEIKKEKKPKSENSEPNKKQSAPKRTERVLWGDIF